MNARFLTTATLAFVVAGILPAKAADPQLLSLVMPDAKVLAGVNVDQAKATPFGQYVLSQMQSQDQHMQKLVALTGFDPTRDVHELLVASNAVGNNNVHSGLFLARGTFDGARIAAVAQGDGAALETYKSVTIIKDPQGTNGLAFLSSSLVVAGDIASVKAAIDRQNAASVLPANVMVMVNQWSTSQDAWAVSAVPPSSLHPAPGSPQIPGLQPGSNAFQTLQSAAGGVKFGTLVVVSAQAQSDNAQDATTLGDTLKLLANLAQMQASNDPAAQALAQSLKITTSGNILNVSLSLPDSQLEQIVKPKATVRRGNRAIR